MPLKGKQDPSVVALKKRVCQNIIKARSDRGLTRLALADECNKYAKFSRALSYQIDNKDVNLTLGSLYAIANALDVAVADLLK